ncbi:MAG: hypothetical protein AAF628_01260 [Planctomycetota bacterium]
MGLQIEESQPVLNATLGQTLPSIINLGSGKNFREDALNLDIEAGWSPDLVADLNEPFPAPGRRYATKRFGAVEIRPGTFDEIVAQDVLEHIRELPTAMTSCLDLLRVGGVLRVSVPYDLSLGAWSDPTHVRAFNERSWDYYTKWCWYFGWQEYAFHQQKIEFEVSELGEELAAQGVSVAEISRTPRAVNAMYVELVKIELSEEGKGIARRFRAARVPAAGQH